MSTNKAEKSTPKPLVVAMLTPYEEQLIRHITYLRRCTLGEFVSDALAHFVTLRDAYKPDPELFCDKGIYHTHGSKTHTVKLSVSVSHDARLTLDTLYEQDDRELRTILRSALVEYLNHLHKTGQLKLYIDDLARTPFVD